jgi:Caspase recruitment domain
VKKTTILDSIQRQRKQLEYFIEFEELIAELTNRHLLTPRQTLETCKKQTAYDQIRQLLDFVADFSEEKCEKFLSVLDNERVNQKHVANFIRSDDSEYRLYRELR